MTAPAGARPAAASLPARLAAPLLLLALWELAARAGAGLHAVAGPLEVAGWLRDHAGLTLRATGVTLQAAAAGFAAGNLAALAIAAAAVLVPRAERLLALVALVVFCLPFVATGPILRVLWGPGAGPQATIAALAVYFTTWAALMTGLRAAPQAWVDLLRSYGRGRGAALWHVRLRAALPHLFAGLQIAAPAAILGAMVGEFTGAERGLGVLTVRAMRAIDVPGLWALATVATLVSLAVYAALGALARALDADPPPLILARADAARARHPLARLAGAAAAALLVLALWHALMEAFALNPWFARRPADVWHHLADAPQAAAHRAALARAWVQTMVLAVPGYLAGLALGAALAAAVTLAPALAAGVMPLAVALRAVPILITAPLIVLALGRGAAGTIAIVAVMIFFPAFVACLTGLGRTPGPVSDLFASYAAPRWRRLALAQVPAALPSLFAAARMSVPAAILAATTSEWLATGIGLGGLLSIAAATSAWSTLWAATAVLALTAVLAYAAVEALERAVLRGLAPEQLKT